MTSVTIADHINRVRPKQ